MSLNGAKNNPKIVTKITAVRPRGGGLAQAPPPNTPLGLGLVFVLGLGFRFEFGFGKLIGGAVGTVGWVSRKPPVCV